MRTLRSLSAAMLVALLLWPSVTFAQQEPEPLRLYERALSAAYEEYLTQGAEVLGAADQTGALNLGDGKMDEAIAHFVAKTLSTEEDLITPEQVQLAIREDPDFCFPELDGEDTEEGASAFSPLRCSIIREEVSKLAKRENRTNTLLKDLQRITGGLETTLLFPDVQPSSFMAQMQAITSVWRAGPMKGTDDGHVRILTRLLSENGGAVGAVESLGNSLIGLSPSSEASTEGEAVDLEPSRELTQAVWKYRYGYALTRESYGPEIPEIEAALRDVASLIENEGLLNPPLLKNETLFALFPAESLASLPENVRVWAYASRTGENATDVTFNAGLTWILPDTTVLPSLCENDDDENCEPKLAGTYKKDPVESSLCEHPLGKFGSYLCRKMENTEETPCVDQRNPAPGTIELARCQSPTKPVETIAGPNICEGWAEGKVNPPLEPEKQCNVGIQCGTPPMDVNAYTSEKDENGNITIIIRDNDAAGQNIPSYYLTISMLQHAKRQCEAPFGSNTLLEDLDGEEKNRICCRIQEDAFRPMCRAMAEDGIFSGNDRDENGRELNEETCVQALTDLECEEQGKGRCMNLPTSSLTKDELSGLAGSITKLARDKRPQTEDQYVPLTCNEDMTLMEQVRLEAYIADASSNSNNVCTPNQTVTMLSTIGNAECLAADCILQSRKEHRLIGSYAPLTSGATTALLDACVPPPTAKGTIFTEPGATLWTPPEFNPALMYKKFDESICPGVAPGAPCLFDNNRRLENPLREISNAGSDQLTQQNERRTSAMKALELSDALAQRMATRMMAEYLQSRLPLINAFTGRAADLLTSLTKVRFPTTVCPLNPEDAIEFLDSPLCSPITPPRDL